MTFEQFQASRVWRADLGAATGIDDYNGKIGYTYPTGPRADDLVLASIDDGSGYDGYHVEEPNGDYVTDLDTAERVLFDYAVSEGFL
jgi:hypothetical protein